mgnify:CR=1 FL=1
MTAELEHQDGRLVRFDVAGAEGRTLADRMSRREGQAMVRLIDSSPLPLGELCRWASWNGSVMRTSGSAIGRSARQGEPGVAQGFISLEDELFQRIRRRGDEGGEHLGAAVLPHGMNSLGDDDWLGLAAIEIDAQAIINAQKGTIWRVGHVGPA